MIYCVHKRVLSILYLFIISPLQIAEFTKEASEKWKALSADKKKPFEAAAADDKRRYETEV